jgi:hypothetical protein
MLVIRSSVRPAPAADTAVPEPPAALNGHGHAAAQRYAGARGDPGYQQAGCQSVQCATTNAISPLTCMMVSMG